MLSSSKQFLLQCLSDHLNNRETRVTGFVPDWDNVFTTALAHSVDGILFRQCLKILPSEIKKKYLKQYLAHAAISFKREEILSDLLQRLGAKNIPVIFMKGSVFRNFYPIPALRSMGDIDFIIRSEDRAETDYILQSEMGFERFIENHAVWTYWKENLYIEVHDHMFYENLANRVNYRAYFDQIWEHCHNAPVFDIASDSLFVPDEPFHFLYLMTHTAKHIINNGSGFRAYLDMVQMVKSCDLDWEWITAELQKLELFEFTRKSFALCECWFNVEMPLGDKSLDEDFFFKVTQKTFEDGTFGLGNKKNAGAHTAKEIKRGQGSYLGGALRLTLHKFFPPYRDMQLIPWYKWVDGKPWLMPAAWVYRWAYCAKNKRDDSMDLLTEPFAMRETVEQREALIRSWGL